MLQVQKHDMRPMTTAHLAQTMTLLSMTIDEMQQEIDAELAKNPALELNEVRICPNCMRPLPARGGCPKCSKPATNNVDEPVIFVSPKEDFYSYSGQYTTADFPDDRDVSPNYEELAPYILRQIAPELENDDRGIAAFLLSNIDDDGLLQINIVEAARYHHVPLSKVEEIKRLIQGVEPLGVCSNSPQEAMLVQLEILSESKPVPELATRIIKECYKQFQHRYISEIASKLNSSVKIIEAVISFIGENLNPFPARSHWGDVRTPANDGIQVYHQPDIIIGYLNDDDEKQLVVEIVTPINGILRVNPLFKQAIKETDGENKDVWRNDLERASLFVKCIQQRNHTMKRLMQRIVHYQTPFITNGPKFLKPITRVKISEELEVHESTISRAVANKTVQLPNKRIIPLASFFDRSLNVRSELIDIIEDEKKPLSDTQLVKKLAERGYKVARRTVAKYRAMEGILPAHLRRAAA